MAKKTDASAQTDRSINVAEVTIRGIAPYRWSDYIKSPKKAGESGDAHDERVYTERMHLDDNGFGVIPAMAIKKCVDAAAMKASERIPGRGMKTYSQFFISGWAPSGESVVVLGPDGKPYTTATVRSWRGMVHAQPQLRDKSPRVPRRFPQTHSSWTATFTAELLSPDVPPPVFERYLADAGLFVGLGTWAPRNGGLFGKFKIESIKWSKIAI